MWVCFSPFEFSFSYNIRIPFKFPLYFIISLMFCINRALSRFQVTRRCLCQNEEVVKQPTESEPQRSLTALDFDLTLIQQDSYLAVSRLLTQRLNRDEMPNNSWMVYIRHVLKMLMLHDRIDAKTIGEKVRHLPPVPGMMRLLLRLSRVPGMDMCIISDANCYFINEWLDAHGLTSYFQNIYTNPATVLDSGELRVYPYEHQTDCNNCPINLCKGGVMRLLMADGNYNRIIYVGDGLNDLCPILQLGVKDIACIRRGFTLHRSLPKFRNKMKCRVISWRDGHELLDHLSRLRICPIWLKEKKKGIEIVIVIKIKSR